MNPMLFLRWLLSPEGDGGGTGAGGSVPTPTLQRGADPGQQPPGQQPPPQPGQGQPPPNDAPVTQAQLVELLNTWGNQFGQQLHNSVFAQARRAGMLPAEGNGRRAPAAPAAGQPTDPGQPAPSQEELLMERIERRGAMDRTLTAQNRQMSEAGRRRMLEALDREAPPDVTAWVNQWFTDLGQPAASSPPPPPGGSSPPPTNPLPAGSRPSVTGSVPAPAGSAPSSIRDPYTLSSDDVQTMIRAHGWHNTGTQIMDALRQAPPRRLQIRRR